MASPGISSGTRQLRYALPLSIAVAVMTICLITFDEVMLPRPVNLFILAIGIAGAIAPIVADEWDPDGSLLGNLIVWSMVIGVLTWIRSVRMPDDVGEGLGIALLAATASGWLAWLYRKRDENRTRRS